MAWQIRIERSAEGDLALFDDLDALSEVLLRWVERGPPGTEKRRAFNIPFYEDITDEGIRIQYFVGTQPVLYVAIVRLRPPSPKPPEQA